MKIDLEFPGGLRVDALVGPHRIATDQSPSQGGDGSAPSPLTLFYASLATCAGFYALRFCRARGLSTEGLATTLETDLDGKGGVARVRLRLGLPREFPPQYREAIRRAVEQCAVHRFVLSPAPIEIGVEEPQPALPL